MQKLEHYKASAATGHEEIIGHDLLISEPLKETPRLTLSVMLIHFQAPS